MQAIKTDIGHRFQRVLKQMGNRFAYTVVASDEHWANQRIEEAIAEVTRIETLLTTFNDKSQTNQINAFAGIKPVAVDQEVFDLISRSLKISSLTQGAFDLSYGSIDKRFWNFDTQMTHLPDRQSARQAVKLIDYRNIILDEKDRTVFLKEKGMRIGFGGIGKGYAADRARTLLQDAGVVSGVVNAAGDLSAWGNQENGKPWTIGIADPNNKQHPFSHFSISNMSVATSGNYEKFVLIDGRKYSHTIDPKTGFPVSGIKSVTIVCKSAELADALATPVMVMGIKVGLNLINQLPNVACIIIDEENRVHTSEHIKISR